MDLAISTANNVSKGSCSTCPDLVKFHKHGGISWEIFPPMPIPGLDMAIMCIPNSHKKWGFHASDEVEHLLDDEDCGLESGAEGLIKKEKRNCKGLYAKQNKRASFLGIPVVFLQQLAVCGRCTVCEAFAKVKDLWKKLKYAARKVVSGLMKAKEFLFGFSYASQEVRDGMKERFATYFPVTKTSEDHGTSMLETAQSNSDSDEGQEQIFHDALMKHLQGKTPEIVQQHLSMLEKSLDQADLEEDDQLDAAKKALHGHAAQARQNLEEQLPTLLSNKECQQLVQTSLASQVLTITLYVELPHALNAALHLVMGNIAGALHSLLPKIYLQATPHGGGHASATAMDKCLQALQAQRKPLIDTCTHEHPLLSCTARTYQRLMEGALSQRWWPLRHDEKGTTVGSINLGYKYDSLMQSLQCAAKDSCLEMSLANLEQKELTVSEMEKADQNQLARLEQLQCAFAGSRIDKEDGEKGQLPVFTDKIWAAGLKAHAWSLEHNTRYSASCPSMVPFVAAFCAEDLKCMDADKAGEGMLQPLQFEMVAARAREAVQELSDLSMNSVHGKEDLQKLATFWDKMAKSEVWELTPEEDIYQWNLLWRAANASSKAGVLSTWPTIVDALMGKNKTYVDWAQTTKYWEKVLQAAFVKMRVRTLERKKIGEKVPDGVGVDKIMTNLNSIFDTKFCSPGALGGMPNEDLQRMGISEETKLFAATFAHEKSAVVRQWKKWMAFNIKLDPTTKRQEVVKFKQALRKAKCGCMCYDSCGKKEASAFVHCSAGLLDTPKELLGKASLVASLFAKEVVVDWVFAVGRKFMNAMLRIFRVPGHGACGYRLSMNAQEVKHGEKEPQPKRKRVTLSGFVSECEVPDFFELSPGEDLRVTAWSEEEQTGEHMDWALQLNGKWEDFEDFLSDSEPSLDETKTEFEESDGPTKFEDGIRANDELAFLDDLDMGEVEDGLLNDLRSDSLDTIDSLQEG